MWYLQFHFVCAKLFVILDCSFIFSSNWVYFVVGRPLISYPIGGFLSTSSAEPLLNSRDYREVFVDTIKNAALSPHFCYRSTVLQIHEYAAYQYKRHTDGRDVAYHNAEIRSGVLAQKSRFVHDKAGIAKISYQYARCYRHYRHYNTV